jgi:DNA-binding MurR/RpiR family transcriptional regulator
MNTVTVEPPVGGTVAHIRSLVPSLGPSEQRVAQAIAAQPDEVAMMSVADLAALTETSSATIIRTCQSLGFKGFQHLRLLLLRDLGTAARQENQVVAGEGSRASVPALFAAATRDLQEALGALDYEQFDAAVAAIVGARRLLIVANGGSGPSAQMLALRFITTGRPCEAPYDSITQQLSARLLGADDVCIAVSDSGMNSTTIRSAEAAVASGATLIGVTSYARSRLSELSTHTVVAGAAFHTWADGAVTGNVVQTLILSALQESVAQAITTSPSTASTVLDEVMGIVEQDESPEGANTHGAEGASDADVDIRRPSVG